MLIHDFWQGLGAVFGALEDLQAGLPSSQTDFDTEDDEDDDVKVPFFESS